MAFISVARQLAAPAPPAAAIIDNGSKVAVTEVFTTSGETAQTASDAANTAVKALATFNPILPAISAQQINMPTVSIPVLGVAPIEPTNINPSFPNAPSDITVAAVPSVDLGAVPDYSVASPFLIDVDLPDPLSALLPSAPTLSIVALPVEPTFVFPSVPTLNSLNLPSVPVLDIPVFTDMLDDGPTAPTASFTYAEVAYNTTLLGDLNSRLIDMVNGASTGLTPAVENAIWQRGRDREALVSQRAIDEATRVFAARGFSIPGGVLLRTVQQALQDSIGRDAALSRDIMIKQGELEQSNFQFSFNAAIGLETQLMNLFNTVQGRALDAAKFTFQAVIQIFNAQVQLYQADAQAFGIKAQVFQTRLQAALSQLEIYRSELEGQRLISDINTQQVQQYTAQLDGVRTLAEVYRTRVDAVNAQINVQRTQVEIYTAQLSGYDSQVRSKATEYQAYATQVQAQLTKVEMFGQQVGAYKSRVDAYGVLVNAKLSAQTMDFRQLQEFPLEVYKQRVNTYQTSVAAESSRVQALINTFESRVQTYAAIEQAKTANAGVAVDYSRAFATMSTSAAQVAIQASQANLTAAISSNETVQASVRAAAQVSGQLAAAAMASRSAHASISDSASNGTSYSVGNSASISNSNGSSWSDSGTVSDITTHKGSDD